jgi:hypothetical protein
MLNAQLPRDVQRLSRITQFVSIVRTDPFSPFLFSSRPPFLFSFLLFPFPTPFSFPILCTLYAIKCRRFFWHRADILEGQDEVPSRLLAVIFPRYRVAR